MLSASFTNWALSLNPIERVLVAATPVKRSESLKEFFAARSTN